MENQSITNGATTVQPLSKSAIRASRHKAELPLYTVLVVINVVAVIVCIAIGLVLLQTSFAAISAQAADEALSPELTEQFQMGLLLAAGVFILAIFMLVKLYQQHANVISDAVQVTPKNFPEIYEKSKEFAQMLGLKKLPPIYIAQQNGSINAFASALIGRRYVQLNAEIVDIAYMEHQDFAPVYFVLGHEMAHIYYRHVAFPTIVSLLLTNAIPVLRTAYSRAAEYSCDRLSQLLNNTDGAKALFCLTAGRHLYQYVDIDGYLDSAKQAKGLFVWFVNLMSSHPIAPKRIAALADSERKSGKIF